ncbi:MAG: glycosyltransferase, partial [Baekduia sp.]
MMPQPGADASPIYGKAGAIAPVAVCVFDVDRPADLDLGTTADGQAYRSALIVLRRANAPVGAMVIAVDGPSLGAFDVLATAEEALKGVELQPGPLSDTGPLVTVVVTTCDQPEQLMRCLDALESSHYRPFEIVVVENRPGPQSGTREAVRGYARVRYVEEPVPGLSRARNAGLAVARGEVVAFTDDDVVVDPDWLPALVAAFDAAPDVAAVTGLILPLTLDSEAQLLLEQFAACGKGLAPGTPRRAAGRARDPLFPYTAGALGSGANTAVRTAVLRAMGGFDATLGAGTPAMGGEDLDLLIRLILDGHAVRYEPRALLWHDHPATMARLTTQVRSYGVGLAAMAAKHLTRGDERAYLLRQAPSVFRYLLSPASRKNEQKGPEFPRELVVRERLGMVQGPLALARSRREARRADAASAAFRPTWIGQVDRADGLGDLVA